MLHFSLFVSPRVAFIWFTCLTIAYEHIQNPINKTYSYTFHVSLKRLFILVFISPQEFHHCLLFFRSFFLLAPSLLCATLSSLAHQIVVHFISCFAFLFLLRRVKLPTIEPAYKSTGRPSIPARIFIAVRSKECSSLGKRNKKKANPFVLCMAIYFQLSTFRYRRTAIKETKHHYR